MTGCKLLRAMRAQSRPHSPVAAKRCRKAKPCFAVLHLKSPGLRAWHNQSHHGRPSPHAHKSLHRPSSTFRL